MARRVTAAMAALTPAVCLAVCLWAVTISRPASAQVLDRIAVTVGKRVIAESEILTDARVAAFIEGTVPDLSPAAKRRTAERLVDQVLLLEDAAGTHVPLPTVADVKPLLDPLKQRYATTAEYQDALKQLGITEADLTRHLLGGLQALRYADLRFRPEAQISEEELRTYFENLMMGGQNSPGAVQAGQGKASTAKATGEKPSAPKLAADADADFESSRAELTQLLINQQVASSTDRWLEMARVETRIAYRAGVFGEGAFGEGATSVSKGATR
jgi:hypothetical protein